MNLSRQELISFIAEYVRPVRADFEASLIAALDALEFGAPLSDTMLQLVVDAASSERVAVYEISTTILGELAERDRNALESVKKMAKARQAHVRHNALLCLNQRTPNDECIALIRSALKDKSVRVRRKAADTASALKVKSVLPDMEQAKSVEHDQETRDLISHEIQMLRQGYDSRPSGEGVTYVNIDSPTGGRIGIRVQNIDIEERGLSTIVSEFLSRNNKMS